MAATWVFRAAGATFAASKSMLDVMNGGASTTVVRVYRVFQYNNQTTPIVGVMTSMAVRRISSAVGGSAVTGVPFDTSSPALNAATTSATGATTVATATFRAYMWSTDEPAVSAATMDEWECLMPYAEVWNSGDSNLEPIVLRPGEGSDVVHTGSTAVGQNDFEMIATNT